MTDDVLVTEPDPTEAAEQHRQVVEAAAIAWAARRVVEALDAGMPITSARRWPRYLARKMLRHERPIELDEAVRQCREARR